jgi:molecular chaperone GrpE
MNDPNLEKTSDANEPAAQPAVPAKPDESADLYGLIDKLNEENSALKDRLLRTLAEMENLRRRTEREVADARSYGVTRFAKDMLEFADNIQRALANVPAEARHGGDAALQALIEGMELIERNFLTTLTRHGVTKIEPKGSRFDPNLHEALFEVVDPTQPSGTVAQVVETGYSIGDRVLRPAKVGVSRGGPKAVRGDDESAAAAEAASTPELGS